MCSEGVVGILLLYIGIADSTGDGKKQYLNTNNVKIVFKLNFTSDRLIRELKRLWKEREIKRDREREREKKDRNPS